MGAWKRSGFGTSHAASMSAGLLAMLSPLLPLLPTSGPLATGSHVARAEVRQLYVETGTIQQAIEESKDGDVILVAPGVYREHIDLLGKAITVRSEAGAEFTLIDGGSFEGGGGSTVVMASGEGPDTRLEGFSIAGGSGTAISTGGPACGGGLLLLGTSPIVSQCLILNNRADRGGAVYTEGGTPVFVDCWFHLNESRTAAIECVRSRPQLLTCGFHEDGIQWEETGAINIRSDCGVGGACCVRDTCIQATRTACDDARGRYQGDAVPCVDGVCPPACEADVNGDRRVNMTDMLLLLDAWGMCE